MLGYNKSRSKSSNVIESNLRKFNEIRFTLPGFSIHWTVSTGLYFCTELVDPFVTWDVPHFQALSDVLSQPSPGIFYCDGSRHLSTMFERTTILGRRHRNKRNFHRICKTIIITLIDLSYVFLNEGENIAVPRPTSGCVYAHTVPIFDNTQQSWRLLNLIYLLCLRRMCLLIINPYPCDDPCDVSMWRSVTRGCMFQESCHDNTS